MSVWKFRGPGSIHLVPSSSHKLDTASNVTTPCRVHNLESLLRQSSFQRAKIVLPTQCNIDYPKSIQIGDFEWRELTHQKFIFILFSSKLSPALKFCHFSISRCSIVSFRHPQTRPGTVCYRGRVFFLLVLLGPFQDKQKNEPGKQLPDWASPPDQAQSCVLSTQT